LGILELLLNTPSASHRPGHHRKLGASRAEYQVIGLFCWMSWDATMSNQCCPSSRPSMQNGQTRPLEKKRSFCASLHAEAPPILLVDEPLFCLCHRQKGASFGSHHPNLFGRGDSQGKPVLVVFQPGSQI